LTLAFDVVPKLWELQVSLNLDPACFLACPRQTENSGTSRVPEIRYVGDLNKYIANLSNHVLKERENPVFTEFSLDI
jgi:hypothetical protein